MEHEIDEGKIEPLLTKLVATDARQHLRMYDGTPCAYGDKFKMIKSHHGTRRIRAYVEISARGMNTETRSYILVPNVPKNIGCGSASQTQPKKFEILHAEYI